MTRAAERHLLAALFIINQSNRVFGDASESLVPAALLIIITALLIVIARSL